MRIINLTLALSLLSAPAFAQDIATEELEKKTLGEKKKDDKKKEDPDGWKVKGNVGLTGSFSDARNVVGAEEGTTLQVGLVLAMNADWKSGQNGWENELKIQQTQSKPPQLDSFVKAVDQVDLKSTYLYRLLDPKWLGFFGRFKLNTQALRTRSIRVNETRYQQEGSTEFQVAAPQVAFVLAGPFEPLTLRESAGAFANPLKEDAITLKAGLGLAAQHVIVREGRIIANVEEAVVDDATGAVFDRVTYTPLDSQNDFGLELTVDAKGIVVKDLLSWKASIDLFQPVLPGEDDDTKPQGIDRLNADFNAGLSLKLAKWLSADYVLILRRQPQVVEDWQIQNQILLSAGFDII